MVYAAEPAPNGPEIGPEIGILGGWVPWPAGRQTQRDGCATTPEGPLVLLGGRLGYRVSQVLVVEAVAGWTPPSPAANATPTVCAGPYQPSHVVESLPDANMSVVLGFRVLHGTVAFGESEPAAFDFTLRVGSGAVHTEDYSEDNLDVWNADTRLQWHPSLEAGAGLMIQPWTRTGLRVDLDTYSWLEVSEESSPQIQAMSRVSLGVSWSFGAAQEAVAPSE